MRLHLTFNESAGSSWTETVFHKLVPIRVLIVADGNIKFLNDLDLLSLTRFRALLEQVAFRWEKLTITTAHRSDGDTGAQIRGFKFDATSASGEPLFTIKNYEQLWLFGFEREGSRFSLSDRELRIISTFMTDGGGVFATGDHEDLGYALCGKLPRVRSMRKWRFASVREPDARAPERNGPTRIDTLRMGTSEGFQAGDQSDGTPQQICPRFRVDEDGRTVVPHPVLADGGFAVTILPDHMHEGECVIPGSLDQTYQFDGQEEKEEYPMMLGIPARVSPVTVAIATSASGLLDLEERPPVFPVEPRCFKIITAYDGHYIKQFRGSELVKLGRVVVDSSFHHFVNLNLKGFFVGEEPNADMKTVQKYYRNLLTWLTPAALQQHFALNLLLALRYSPELIEEFQPQPTFRWDEILHAGGLAWAAIAQDFSTAEARSTAMRLAGFLPDDIRRLTKDYLDAWLPVAGPSARPRVLLDPKLVPMVILGSGILGIVSSLPENSHEVAEFLSQRETQGENLEDFVKRGLMLGMASFARVLRESNEVLGEVAQKLSAAVP